jgi:hypothetical protein
MHVALCFKFRLLVVTGVITQLIFSNGILILHVTSLGLYMKNINNVAFHSIAVKCKRPFQSDRTSTGLEAVRNM